MQYITLHNYERVITECEPLYSGSYDVIVAGLGTAGTEAALLCAQLNLKTLGIEYMNGMGGVFTYGGMAFITADFHGGVCTKREQEIDQTYGLEETGINKTPARLYAYDQMSDRCHLDTLYEASVIGIYEKDGVIHGVRTVCNGMIKEYHAEHFIDCTTNAVLCRMAGCEIRHGRKDGGQMAFSKVVQNVQDRFRSRGGFSQGNWATINTMTKPSAEEYSHKVMEMSCVYPCSWKEEKKRVVHEANLLGSREDGQVVTEETVTFLDALENKQVRKPVFYAEYPCDIVRPDRDFSLESDAFIIFRILCGLNYCHVSTGIPHGSIIPKGTINLLVASKCFGASHDALSGLRMCSTLKKCAEAAAYTIQLARKYGVNVREVPYEELKQLMIVSGAFCEEYNVGVIDLGERKYRGTYQPVKLYSKEQIIEALKQDIVQDDDQLRAAATRSRNYKPDEPIPGLAYFTMFMSRQMSEEEKEELTDFVYQELKKGGRYAGNLAIALGLAQDKRGVSVLLDIVKHPGEKNVNGYDPVIERTVPNRVKALYLLGKLKVLDAIEPILDMLEDYADEFSQDLPPYELFETHDSYKYLSMAYGITALYGLLCVCPKPEYIDRVKRWREQHFEIYSYTCTRNLSEVLFYTADKIIRLREKS